MKFWDSSAVLLLLVEQSGAEKMSQLFQADETLVVWWATRVECASALARLEREAALTSPEVRDAFAGLDALAELWAEVEPTQRVRDVARRLLRTHTLRATDALPLAAAIVASEDHPAELSFVCLDHRLTTAAIREGFHAEGE